MGTDEAERDEEDTARNAQHVHRPELVLVFADDYRPEVTFRVVDRIPQRPVNEVLGYRVEGEPAVSNPTDYNGYIIDYPNLRGEYAFAFVNRRTLQQDQRYQFTDDVVFFDIRLNLVSASLTTASEEEPSSETPTPADETTIEVVVETSETEEEGGQ